ncbi:hypothetical protein [Candidatus Nitrosotenuis cloacae]|uniref:hypothetical protein n=1 Tax=Candidatus Nitrosotenuis cloacae TaxID=1603555 RepID=UPI00227DC2D4|nr:hypothetical protein [Candidatus Nitrosotenuis cloacae]
MSEQKYTHFRCSTCKSAVYPIHEIAPIKDIPMIDFHKKFGCEIQYLTYDEYAEYRKSVTQNSNSNTNSNTNSDANRKKPRFSMKRFLHACMIINRMGFDVVRDDFPELSDVNFRQYILRATQAGKIETVIGGLTPSYRIVGEATGKQYGVVTLKRMGVGLELEKTLRDTNIAYPKIHDIRLKTPTEGLHEYLSKIYPVNKTNGRIKLPVFNPRPFTFLTVSVYPKTIEIIIECSRMPIIYDVYGAQDFILMLSEIRERLLFKTKYNREIKIDSVLEWIVTQYHFNKDEESKQYSGEHFEVRVKDMSVGTIRFYSKLFPDGVTRTRLENIRNPNASVLDEVGKMIMTGNYVRNTSGIKLTSDEARKVLDIIPNSSNANNDTKTNKPSVIVINGSSVFNPMQDRLYSF